MCFYLIQCVFCPKLFDVWRPNFFVGRENCVKKRWEDEINVVIENPCRLRSYRRCYLTRFVFYFIFLAQKFICSNNNEKKIKIVNTKMETVSVLWTRDGRSSTSTTSFLAFWSPLVSIWRRYYCCLVALAQNNQQYARRKMLQTLLVLFFCFTCFTS